MGKIIVKGIKLYAFHGCTDEEQKIGTHYEIDVIIETNLENASISDNLNDTIDYVGIYEIVKEQMSIKSRLIEHVAKRIINQSLLRFTAIETIKVTVSKLNPPINGIVERVSVVLEKKRK